MVFLVEPVQRVRTTFFLQVLFDTAELLAELAVEHLVVQDLLEVGSDRRTVELKGTVQLAVLRYARVMFQLEDVLVTSTME